jgi:hypothetical protein
MEENKNSQNFLLPESRKISRFSDISTICDSQNSSSKEEEVEISDESSNSSNSPTLSRKASKSRLQQLAIMEIYDSVEGEENSVEISQKTPHLYDKIDV